MIPFQAPLDDIFFSLRHVADADGLPGWDGDMAAEIAGHFADIAEGVIAPLNASGDREGCRLEDGRVIMPRGFAAAYRELAEGGWQGLTAPEEYGGQGLDHLTAAALSEIFSGANHAMQMVTGLVPGAVSVLAKLGSEAQKSRYIPKLASGELLATMCLTEPGAGSDLSRVRTKACRDGNQWRIDGEKIFISGGGQDMSEGTLHLILARNDTRAAGTSGLSLFLCPSDAGGSRNSVSVTRIEEKLGLHASPTCQMAFDGAEAEMIGEEGRGLAAMFILMNHARLDVAMQGVAHASRAHAIASAYAGERKQGRDPDGRDAVLSDHADVRRMLDEQRILGMAARSLCHVTLVELERGTRPALTQFLTSLGKIYGTEAGIRSADLGIQILGGYGYLEEYGLSQIWRDARITSIYEGTNGIHAQGLATRCLRLEDGQVIDQLPQLVDELSGGAGELAQSVDHWRNWARELAGSPDAPAQARRFADVSARLLQAALWERIANVAGATGRGDAGELARLAGVVRQSRQGEAEFRRGL